MARGNIPFAKHFTPSCLTKVFIVESTSRYFTLTKTSSEVSFTSPAEMLCVCNLVFTTSIGFVNTLAMLPRIYYITTNTSSRRTDEIPKEFILPFVGFDVDFEVFIKCDHH